jgi:hypothetical protein
MIPGGNVESGHAVWYPPDPLDPDRRLYILTGVVLLTMKGEGRSWRRESFAFCLGLPSIPSGQGLLLEQWAPMVTLNSIANDQTSVDAGWAVDGFRLLHTTNAFAAVTVEADLAVRDVDGFVLRLGYAIHLIGRLAPAFG